MNDRKVSQEQLDAVVARIMQVKAKLKQFKIDDIPLENSIFNPQRFEKAIALYQSTDNEELKRDLVYSLGKYVWYNYYQYTHIKKDSPEDKANERIYKALEASDQELYKKIEKWVDFEIDKLNNPEEYGPLWISSVNNK